MKILTIAAIMLLVIVLSGCMRLDIYTGIDADSNAYLQYDLEVDLTKIDDRQKQTVNERLRELEYHYRDTLGFEVNCSEDDERYHMTAAKIVHGSSYEDAFAKLKEILTDETVTPFFEVGMDFSAEKMQQLYLLDVTVDSAAILAASSFNELPESMKENIEESIRSYTGTLTIELPGSEIEYASGVAEIDGYHISLTAPLDFFGQTQVELTTRLNTMEQTILNDSMEDIISKFRAYGYAGLGLAGIGLVMVVVGIVIMRRGKARKDGPAGNCVFPSGHE